jgi:signal transduction histidine kinase
LIPPVSPEPIAEKAHQQSSSVPSLRSTGNGGYRLPANPIKALVDTIRKSPSLTLIVRTVIIALAYSLSGEIGLWSAKERVLWPTLWFPSAVGLTAVTFWGPRAAIGIGLGALLMRLFKDPSLLSLLNSVIPNVVEAYIGSLLLGKHFGLPKRRLTTQEVPELVLSLAMITNIGAIIGTATQVFTGSFPSSEIVRVWWSWWSGNAAAVILIAPIWLWGREIELQGEGSPVNRRIVLFIGVAMGLALSFLPMPEGATPTPMWRPTLAFLPYLLIHGVSLSLGARSVAFGGAIVGVVISLATNLGHGPFATTDPLASYDAACLFNLVTGTSTLWLSTLAAERNLAARALAMQQKQLEATVLSRTRDLEERTNELQSFSYAVSHDLRAPLRGISGWIFALEEDCGAQLDATGQRHLERIRNEAQRMGILIEGLLSLSRISATEIRIEPIDISGLGTEILSRLAEAHPDRIVRTEVHPGIIVDGDEVLCEIALTNILENAWKFTAKCPEARIGIEPVESPQGQGFRVRDNGTGFAPSNRDRLFIPFQRFHRASEFPGTGIGLATVHRIARRHGGSLEVESTPGVGTIVTMVLIFPKTEARSKISMKVSNVL